MWIRIAPEEFVCTRDSIIIIVIVIIIIITVLKLSIITIINTILIGHYHESLSSFWCINHGYYLIIIIPIELFILPNLWQQVVTEKNHVSNIHLPTSTTNSPSIHGENIPSHFPPSIECSHFCHPKFFGWPKSIHSEGASGKWSKKNSTLKLDVWHQKTPKYPVSNSHFSSCFKDKLLVSLGQRNHENYHAGKLSPVCLMCPGSCHVVPWKHPQDSQSPPGWLLSSWWFLRFLNSKFSTLLPF